LSLGGGSGQQRKQGRGQDAWIQHVSLLSYWVTTALSLRGGIARRRVGLPTGPRTRLGLRVDHGLCRTIRSRQRSDRSSCCRVRASSAGATPEGSESNRLLARTR